MGTIAAITLVAVLTGTAAPGTALHHFAPRAPSAIVAAVPHDRTPRTFSAPVVAYSGTSGESVAVEQRDETGGAFSNVAEYAAFEPERAALPSVTRRETLLARVRRAASRILAVAERMPHF